MKLDTSTLLDAITIADGGWSTQLQIRGFPADQVAEHANLTHPTLVAALSKAYADAGARFITTNTFAANHFTLSRRDLGDELERINHEGARVAYEAVGERVVVAGSIGPSGKILAVKEAPEDELRKAFATQAKALADGGADAIILETFSEPAEILLALAAVRDVCDLPVICSMSFDSGPQRTRTMMGAQAAECAAALEDAGADVVGCNCGVGIDQVLPAVVALRAGTSRPLWVKPNAGLPELIDGKPTYRQTPEEFASHAPTLVEAGVNILGGCCGSGPDHIARLAQAVTRKRRLD